MPDVPLCVYCRRKPVEFAWRPFCSERCKMADLGRWLSGDYRVPGPPDRDGEPGTPAESDGPNADADNQERTPR
jgi:endogenous inhibitor of DNA gyrase (YacG/DUF329 family)